MANSFTFNDTALLAGLDTYADTLTLRVTQVLAPFADTIEQDAKRDHAWQNQTGNAERGLNAGVVPDVAREIVTLYLQHGPDIFYGWWLETKFGGRFAVVNRTLEAYYTVIMSALEGAL